MKKFLKNYDFEDNFDFTILSRGKNYYEENRILDIWCQDDRIIAYIDGTEIYRVELRANNNELNNFYCSCPYSEDGQYMCKHIAAVLYHLKENDVPELETLNNKKVKNKSQLSKIYDEMNYELRKISDRNGFVNYYNGRYFVDLISNVSNHIYDFIDNEEYSNAFELIKYAYRFIKDTFMDGSNGEFQDSLYLINESASKLLYNDEYFNIFLDYTEDISLNNTLDDFSDCPLHAFILYVHDKDSALKVVRVLDEIKLDCFGIFVDQTLDKISITYDFISKNNAIKMCYENIEHYGVKELLIKYLKKDNKIDEVIRLLKDDIKNHVRKDMAYDKLLNIYDEYNMLEEKKKLLPEVIVKTSSFKRYKELKNMYNVSEWKSIKKTIISKIKTNNIYFLEKIYAEENEIDKLFELLKKNFSLSLLAEYQDILKFKYNNELLEFYKPQIIESSKMVSDRNAYYGLCRYIGIMKELDGSDDFIFDMLKEMYPNYKSKRAFKEEIANVLSSKNKQRFYELINN